MSSFGLIGEKLSHSLSPKIHKLILQYINKVGDYQLFELVQNQLGSFTNTMKTSGLVGTNVTIPYKQDIMEYLDSISDSATRIGAVNTVTVKNGRLCGDNTDYYGFGYMLEIYGVSVLNKTCVILGNGGACRAVLYYLIDNGAKEVYICSRDPKDNLYNNEKIKVISYKELSSIKGEVLINSTPVGMYPKVGVSPVDEELIKNYEVLVDLIYNPRETEFLRLGNINNIKTVGGLEMLIGQAVKAQELWQGEIIDKRVIQYVRERL